MSDQHFTFLSEHAYPALMDALAKAGAKVHILRGESIVDLASLFEAAAKDLPMGDFRRQPRSERDNPSDWTLAGFRDYLWQGLSEQRNPRQAIVWVNADRLRRSRREDFDLAVEALQDVSESLLPETELGSGEWTDGDVDLRIFLVGAGPAFPEMQPAVEFAA